MKITKNIAALLCALLCAVLLAGCGRSLIITTGFGRGDAFRIGSESCKISEVRVYLLDLQKENERLFGKTLWESENSPELQEAVKEQALARITRVKALNQLAVKRNVMLTDLEKREAEEAEHNYYAALSAAEIKYIDLDEKNLQRMFREYALADKTWTSLGETAEQTYGEFYDKTQCDLNTKYWQTVTLKRIEGDLQAPGFADCYEAVFANAAAGGDQGSTQEAAAVEAGQTDQAGVSGAAAESGAAGETDTESAAGEAGVSGLSGAENEGAAQ